LNVADFAEDAVVLDWSDEIRWDIRFRAPETQGPAPIRPKERFKNGPYRLDAGSWSILHLN
jgi:hypothetical protein